MLNAVGECGRRALSVSASLWQHVQGEDSVASFASSHSSPRLGGAEGGGGERPHHRGSRQPQPQLVHAAAEHSSSQRSCGGDARSGVSDAAGGSASVCSPAAAAKSSTARPRNNKAWVTCPPAWWANDSETAGEDAQQQVRQKSPTDPRTEPYILVNREPVIRRVTCRRRRCRRGRPSLKWARKSCSSRAAPSRQVRVPSPSTGARA